MDVIGGGDVCSGAAGRGYIEILKWARENGCGWDERTCVEAAKGGHLECPYTWQ